MSVQLDALEVQVKAIRTIAGSAVALINGMAAEIIRLKDDPVKLQQFADELKLDAADLAKAVTDNTPTPPTP